MKEGERRKRKRRGRRPEKTKPGSFSSGNGSRSPQSSSANEDGGGSTVPSSKKRRPNSTKPRAPALSKSSNFLEKMKARLSGGHFRMINEKLYTCSGNEALDYFKDDPSLFDMYHAGYQEQMSHWPEQPVNIIIRWLKDHNPSLVVADFGCGDARLAKNVRNKVFSIDLVSNEPSVIACDMANTPLASSSVDVAVFCLSLMGTNFPSYLQEAHRVLKPSGWLLIAEVKSRFDPNTGGADPNRFSKAICELGFTSACKDFSSKMFILLYFKKKEKQNSDQKEIRWPELKPCLYKRR
ncbi:hypothetical protein Dimus_013626 [Dionaea muscipula]